MNCVLGLCMIDCLFLADNMRTFTDIRIGITVHLMLSLRAVLIAFRFSPVKLLGKRIDFLRLGLLHILLLHLPPECDIQLREQLFLPLHYNI